MLNPVTVPLKLARPHKEQGQEGEGTTTVHPWAAKQEQGPSLSAHCHHVEEENTQLVCTPEDPLWTCMQLSSKG